MDTTILIKQDIRKEINLLRINLELKSNNEVIKLLLDNFKALKEHA
jgi:hypothetical protein